MGAGSAIDAIVVGATDLGEADRLVRFLTAEEGRVVAVARGARSSRKRFAGVTGLGTVVRLTRAPRRRALPVASAIEFVRGPVRAREHLERIAHLAYGCELCSALAPEGAPAPKLYRLLEHWLRGLDDEAAPRPAARAALEGKAATFAGLRPMLVECARCGDRIDDPAVFDPDAGGALHARCGGGRRVPAAGLVELEALRRSPLSAANGLPLDPAVSALLSDFVRFHLGRDLAAGAWWSALG